MNSLYDLVKSGNVFSFKYGDTTLKIIPLSDTTQWEEIVQKYNCDVYFRSGYMKSFDGYSDGLGAAVDISSGQFHFFEPFRVRKINGEPDYCDVSSEYGYAGPILIGDEDFSSRALEILKAFFIEHRVVSGFVRYHPLLQNESIVRNRRNIVHCGQTISVDTNKPFDEILMGIASKKRSDYRRALKKGTTVRLGGLDDIPAFYDVYRQSMKHASASDFYFLSEEFFKNTLTNLKDNSFMLLAEFEGIVVGASIFLFSKDFMHYHFSGKNVEWSESSKANGTTVILCQAAKIASEMGIKQMHLGGGVGGCKDPLFEFKKCFSKTTNSFFVSKDIYLPQKYNELCEKAGKSPSECSFFPAYRG